MTFNNRYFPYVLFLLIAAVAFFQLVFFQHPPAYDMVDCFYPWRFHVGECFQNGLFPFWNPFQDLGYPEYADPSSGVWYPMVWLIGSSVGYNLYTIGLEFYIHVFFAGAGMFMLAQTLKFERHIAFIAAISFMLCGIFVGNAQHLPYIIGAAWLPFVLNFYFRLVHEKSSSNAIYAGFFLFLMITGGYPAFVIILFYFFLGTFLYYFIRAIRHKRRNAIADLIVNHGIFVVTAAIFSIGLLLSVYQVSPYLSRLDDGFTLQQALFSPFSPRSFISFLLPFAVVKFPEFYNGDISMINGYFGLFLFLFFFAGIFVKKSPDLKLILILGVFSLIAAVGDALPVRELLFRYVPMMNVFRNPSVFRLFTLISFILIGANYLNIKYKQGVFPEFRKWILPVSGVVLALIALILVIRANTYLDLKTFISTSLFKVSPDAQLTQFIVFQAGIQIGFLVAFILLLRFVKNYKRQYLFLTLLVVADLLLSAQLNGPYTVYNSSLSAKIPYQSTESLPKGFPPLMDCTIAEAGNLPGLGQPYWQNLNNFQKQISAEGFNSFSFSNYDALESEYPFIFKELQKNKLLLLTDKIRHEASMKKANRDSLYRSDILFFDDGDFGVLRTNRMKHTVGDTAYLKEYDANRFLIRTRTEEAQLLTLFQKDFDGWEARVNGELTPIYRSNRNFITIMLPSGNSEVEIKYRNPLILGAFGVSVFSCLLLLIYILFTLRYPEKNIPVVHKIPEFLKSSVKSKH